MPGARPRPILTDHVRLRYEQKGIDVSVAEVDKEGARLTATMWASSPAERGKKAAELRLRWLRELREHALSSTEA